METKEILSSCSDLEEQEIQQLQKQAKILKENSLKKLNALKTTTQHLSNERTSRAVLSRNIQNLERQLNKETLHEKDSNSDLRVIKRNHEQELQNGLKRLNARKLQIQECKVQEVQASDASSGDKDCSRIVSDKGNDQEPMVEVPYTAEYNVFDVDTQHSEQPECIINTCVVNKADSNVTPDSPDMYDNEIQTGHNDVECDDEHVALYNLIANLKFYIDENKTIQKQLKKANASLTQELKECKSTLAETSRTLGESNSIRDSCLVALQNKQTEFERYKAFNDHTVDYDKLKRKLKETLGLLAQKDIDIKECLKVKAYEISVVKEKHDELVKQSLLTKSHYEGLVKEKTKVITDLKHKEEKDIDKMISMENQLKFLNEIVYKMSQSIQTIHMLAPKCPTFNGRPTFANPMYLKKAQYEIPCLYEIPHDQSDPTNRLVPDRGRD
ncbi:hypothetical protein Tco_1525803 [Tanacetum coccineum]